MNNYRNLVLITSLFFAAMTTSLAETKNDNPIIKSDTLHAVVVTGTRQEVLRDALPVPATLRPFIQGINWQDSSTMEGGVNN